MAKRDTLSFLPDFQEYVVAAIHSAAEPHQLAWLINNLCDASFWRNPDDLKVPETSGEAVFIYYEYKLSETGETYYMIANQGMNGVLVHARPKPDYLLVSNGENAADTIQSWLNELKKDKIVNMTYMLDPALKSKMYWLASLEKYYDN